VTTIDAPAATDLGYIRVHPANIVRSIRHDLDGTWHLNPDIPIPVVFPDQASAEQDLAVGELVQEVSLALPEGGFFQATVADLTSATAAAFTDYATAYEFVVSRGAEILEAITIMEPESSPVCALGPDGEKVLLGHAVAWIQKPFTKCLSFTRPDTASRP
jgi:hypothetical protein